MVVSGSRLPVPSEQSAERSQELLYQVQKTQTHSVPRL